MTDWGCCSIFVVEIPGASEWWRSYSWILMWTSLNIKFCFMNHAIIQTLFQWRATIHDICWMFWLKIYFIEITIVRHKNSLWTIEAKHFFRLSPFNQSSVRCFSEYVNRSRSYQVQPHRHHRSSTYTIKKNAFIKMHASKAATARRVNTNVNIDRLESLIDTCATGGWHYQFGLIDDAAPTCARWYSRWLQLVNIQVKCQ